jgi:ribonuclease BN (tRNA processing enzyme)
MIELIVLGGAAAAPNPGQGCASYLIQAGDTALLVDCGPDTLAVLRQEIDFRSVTAVILSHLHSDHTLDLVPYRYGLKYGPGAPTPRIPLWLPPDGLAFLDRLAAVFAVGGEQPDEFFPQVFEAREFQPDLPLTIGELTITFQQTQHAIPCWAMRLQSGDRTLVYTADTALTDGIVGFAAGADLVVAEATMPDGSDLGLRPIHLTAGQAGELAARAGASRLVLSHYWVELGPDRLRAQAEAQYGGEVIVAEPHLRLEV